MKFLDTIHGKNIGKVPPIWLMRQAGRYLAEYRKVRSGFPDFLEFCYNPDAACEVTLQPIDRFGFDAAIIFSDILTIPEKLGYEIIFDNGIHISKNENTADSSRIDKVYDALRITREKLPAETALIGFSGAPWTVSAYMLEGGSSRKEFADARQRANNGEYDKILPTMIDEISEHLVKQARAGANVLKIFDSHSGILNEKQFNDWVIAPTKEIVNKVRAEVDVPIICFPKGAGYYYAQYQEAINPDVLAVDYTLPLSQAKELQKNGCIQGNLDPTVLASGQGLEQEVNNILDALAGGKFIFNLGHGILPNTPVENVEKMISIIRNS